MKILSLDPSLKFFGWAVSDDTSLIACGCIVTDSIPGIITDSDTKRLENISKDLKVAIDIYKPSLIIFENPVGSKSSRATQCLSFVKGIVIASSIFSGIPYESVRAREIKKKLTGDSSAEKSTVLQKVTEKYPEFLILTKGWTTDRKYAASDAVAVRMFHS